MTHQVKKHKDKDTRTRTYAHTENAVKIARTVQSIMESDDMPKRQNMILYI